MTGPKETVYDEQIAPLMTQIITICQEHKINMFATFALDISEETTNIIRCTTHLPNDPSDKEGLALVGKLLRASRTDNHVMCSAVTISGGRAS